MKWKWKAIGAFETLMSLRRQEVTPLKQELQLIWLASRDPYSEAEAFRARRTPSDAYGLIAWEVDFIKELLGHYSIRYSYVTHPGALTACHIVVYSRNQFKRDEIRRGLRRAAPTIVFHLSDEWGGDAPWHAFLQKYPLVLRQYHFNSYPRHAHIRTIPLGYMEGMFEGPTTSTELIENLDHHERRLAWSFVGGLKGDRGAVLERFRQIDSHYIGTVHPIEMAEIYRTSNFVICPAGNVNILCFRNFEASICGAIPVVAGCSREQYLEATEPLGNPPWVFHEHWNAALEEVKSLLVDEAALKTRRRTVLEWWAAELHKTRNSLNAVLTTSGCVER